MCRALRYMNWRYHATYRLILHCLWFQGTLHFARWLINKDVPFLSIDISRMSHKFTLSRVYGSCIGASSLTLSEASFSALEGQRARTQVCPTNKNCTPCTQCLGNTQDSASEKCNGGRIRGALPS